MRRIRLPALALLSRSLLLDSRALMPYLARFLLLITIAVVLVFTQLVRFLMGASGAMLFGALMYVSFFAITFAGIAFFSAVITEEKEDNTLGLLRMAGFNPISIILGKWVGRLLGMIMLLAVQIPIALLSVTLGGVAVSQVEAAYACLMAYILFLAGLGLLCSTVCQRSTTSAAATTIALLAFFLGPVLILRMADALSSSAPSLVEVAAKAFQWYLAVSPFQRLMEIMMSSFGGSILATQVMANAAFGAGLFLLSWLVFGASSREAHESSQERGLIPRVGVMRKLLGAGRAWRHAVIWKDFHFMSGGRTAIVAKTLLLLGAALLIAYETSNRDIWARWYGHLDWEALGGILFFITLIALYVDVSVGASRIFGQEAKWKTLPDLMTLPHCTARLAAQKVGGYVIGLIPYPLFLALSIVFLWIGGRTVDKLAHDVSRSLENWSTWYVLLSAIMFPYLVAYFSLILKHGAVLLAAVLWFVIHPVMVSMGLQIVYLLVVQSGGYGGVDPKDAIMCAMSLGMAGLVVFSHFVIGRRLRHVAAQG
jgi:ABC-type transport system involved in multi-copper enzyme maturation permease subunit